MQGTRAGDMGELLRELQCEATFRMAVPDAEAARAAEATLRGMSGRVDVGSVDGRSRAAAYFWAVVRRRAFSGAAGMKRYRESCIAATLAEDMRSAGHDSEGVREMLQSLSVGRMSVEDEPLFTGSRLF